MSMMPITAPGDTTENTLQRDCTTQATLHTLQDKNETSDRKLKEKYQRLTFCNFDQTRQEIRMHYLPALVRTL